MIKKSSEREGNVGNEQSNLRKFQVRNFHWVILETAHFDIEMNIKISATKMIIQVLLVMHA